MREGCHCGNSTFALIDGTIEQKKQEDSVSVDIAFVACGIRRLSERSSKREEGGNLSATTEHEDGMKGCVSDLR